MSDQYKTVIGLAESKLEVKKSRFIGLAAAIQSQDAIKDFLRLVQQKYPNASHYCYAYKIEAGSEIRDYATDAGEPTHSAGPPILSAIKTAELSNVICVIVRYYGGINLGVGGLIRAYGGCARSCLASAKIETRILYQMLRLRVFHNQIGPVLNLCRRLRGNILNVEYDEDAIVYLQIRQRELDTLKANLQRMAATIEVSSIATT
jgi:uncharacterized YigZ family protein